MKKVLFYITAAIIAVFTFTSCVEDEYGYPPVYGKVYCVNENPVAGDSLIFRVEIKEPGNGAYKATYTWRVNGVEYKKVGVLDPFVKAPEIGYPNAKAGTYRVSMSASFKMALPMESGQIASSASSQTGTITVAAKQ